MTAVLASFMSALMGRPVDAERWADAVERCKYGDPARPEDPAAEAWGVMVVRATLCRSGAEQMRADADEAVRLLSAGSLLTPTPALMQGIARILCGDLDGGDLSLQDAVSIGEQVDSPAAVAAALGERSLIAMARSEWDRAEALTGQAGTVLRQAGIELIRAHLALADLAGARTLVREVDDLLRRRPGLGNLVAEAETLRTMLATARGSCAPGASALTAAELRLLPMLATHLPYPGIAEEMFLSRNTIKTQANSIYRKLGASARSQAITLSRELGLLEK